MASSKKAVVSAILGNSVVTVLKFGAAFVTHSASMMNEAVHSLMDTLNQIFLLTGLVQGEKPADSQYAFGHGQKKYLWNLWSAIGLFSIGSGLGMAHAWHAYHNLGIREIPIAIDILGTSVNPIWVSVVVLAIAFVLEGLVLFIAGGELFRRMRQDQCTNVVTYIIKSDDPTLIAVVLEDSVAVLGVVFAACGIGLSTWLENPLWDIGFSVLIALMLAVVAFFLGAINMRYLTDIRDPQAERVFQSVVEQHREVERYHDLRSIIVDETHTVLVAEVELREEAMVPGMMERIEEHKKSFIDSLPEKRAVDPEVQQYITTRAIVESTLKRAEEVIDEIESEVKALCPRVFHLTIEVEGIAISNSGSNPDTGILA